MGTSVCFLLGVLCGEVPQGDGFSKEIQENTRWATVRIQNMTQGGYGSGVIVLAERGQYHILTARHVAGPEDSIRVLTYSSDSGDKPRHTFYERACKVMGAAKGADDLAVICVVAGKPAPGVVSICPKKKATRETTIPVLLAGMNAAGAPEFKQMDATKRKVRLPGQGLLTLWSVDKEQEKGWSGGPLVDQQGRLVGICSGRSEGKGYFCTLEQIHQMLYDTALDWLAEDE